jgi:acyl carrier protein
MKSETTNKINEQIRNVACDPELQIKESDKLQDDLNLDSLDTIDLVMKIEKELKITMSDEKIASWKTVQDIYTTVNEYTE